MPHCGAVSVFCREAVLHVVCRVCVSFCQTRYVQWCTAKRRTSSKAARGMHGCSRVAGRIGYWPLVQPPSACCGLEDDCNDSVFLTASTRTFTPHMSGEALLGTWPATETREVGKIRLMAVFMQDPGVIVVAQVRQVSSGSRRSSRIVPGAASFGTRIPGGPHACCHCHWHCSLNTVPADGLV